MRARFLALPLAVIAVAAPAFAQAPPAPMALKSLATSAEVQAAMAKAQAARVGDAATVFEPLASVPPYQINLEYRFKQNGPSVHATEAELLYFVDGAGILTVGGTVVDAPGGSGGRGGAKAIQNGTEVHVSKGDMYIVPQNTPHMLTPVGGPLIDLSMHMPGSAK